MFDPNFRQKISSDIRETNKQVFSQSFGLISSAFILVAALAWNEAIKELINAYFPHSSGIFSRLIYACVVTVIAVIVAIRLNKLATKI